MRKIQLPVLAIIWLVNPVFSGCFSETYTYGQEEMLELMNTLNETVYSADQDGETYSIDFDLVQSPEPQASLKLFSVSATADACAREFYATASACAPVTTIYLEGTIEITDSAGEIVLTEEIKDGDLYVMGYDLNNAQFSVHSTSQYIIELWSEDGIDFEVDEVSWTASE